MTLYCYTPPEGVPDGVVLADAGEVLPQTQVVAYRSGSFSLFSNRFRYELQRRGLGTWLDCDAYLLAPLDGERPYLIGEYEPGKYSPGVLRIPADSPLLPPLLAPFAENEVPDWLPFRPRAAAHLRRALTGRTGVARMPWGTTGPRGLTAVAARFQADIDPLPPEALYPIRWQDAEWVADPSQALEDRITPRTVSVHLWNERIKHLKHRPAAPGSFLARIQEEGA